LHPIKLKQANRYAILFRLQTVNGNPDEKNAEFIAMLERHGKDTSVKKSIRSNRERTGTGPYWRQCSSAPGSHY
jgi:hypothetical protein